MPGKLAHFRHVGHGNPGWNGAAVYQMQGADPSTSYYDQPSGERADGIGDRIRAGIHTMHERLGLSAPTMNRQPRSGATHSTVPAAAFFQGYFNTSFAEAGYSSTVPMTHGALHLNNNPGGFGTKEAHPATVYDPFPAAGSLYPKAV